MHALLAMPLLLSTLVPDPGRALHDSLGGGGAAFQIDSSILHETRRIDIILPASYARSAPERRYPVTLLLDGELHLAAAGAVSQELARNGMIPESILVAIQNDDPYQGRVDDLTPPGLSVSGSGLDAGGDRFLDFIERELLPAVDRQFRGAAPRVLIGHSSGGILATYAAATRPGFRGVIAIDTPITLGDSWLARKLKGRAATGKTPLRFACYEARFTWPEAEWSALVAAAPPAWRLHREKLEKEGHETIFLPAAYLGLREIFADYSRLAAPQVPTTRILPYYESLTASFGAPLTPPGRLLRDVVEDFLMEGRGAAARQAYDALASGYGPPEDGAAILSQSAEAERRPPPAETVDSFLATPFPTPEQARAYIGEWAGDIWMNPDLPRRGRTILRLVVADGKVVASIENPEAPPELRIRRLDYLKVTPAGLSFGLMNGMRPRGLILHEGTLTGETLAGKTRWGGINFSYPAGMGPPDPGFSFTRLRR